MLKQDKKAAWQAFKAKFGNDKERFENEYSGVFFDLQTWAMLEGCSFDDAAEYVHSKITSGTVYTIQIKTFLPWRRRGLAVFKKTQ